MKLPALQSEVQEVEVREVEVQEVEEPLLRALARQTLEDADGDRHEAVPALAARLKTYKELYSQLVDKLVKRACLEEIAAVVRSDRSTVWGGGHPRMTEASDRVVALARSNLMNFVLTNDKRLADASGAECMESSEKYLKQGETMCHLGRWLRLIGQDVPDGKTVSKVLSEDRLNELRAEAEKNGNE